MRVAILLLASASIAALPMRKQPVVRAAPVCITGLEWLRDSSFTQFTGVIQRDSALAYSWPTDVPLSMYASATDVGRSGKVFAHLLLYDSVQGPAVSALDEATPGRRPKALYVVPWQTDDDCRRVAWTDDSFPIPAGDSAFVSIAVRPRSRWIRGVPTADLDMFTRVYAQSLELAHANLHSEPVPVGLPSAGEYYQAFQHFPSAILWPCTPRSEYESLRDWLATMPALGGRPLFRDILASIAEAVSSNEQFIRRGGVCKS